MGLMYVFPAAESETERVEINESGITLKTYGLPMIFWGYLGAILIVVLAMWIGAQSVITKLLTYDDVTLKFLGWLVLATLIIGPLILIGFYFYEKYIIKKGCDIIVQHRIFFIPVLTKKYKLDNSDALSVDHYLDSPNIAKIKQNADMRGFQNKGYFELLMVVNGQKLFLDRHSRKADLLQMKDLLSKY